MNVSNVSSATCSCQSYQSPFKQQFQDFKALGTALDSGDLTSAQSALAAFQKDLQNSSQGNQPFAQNPQAAQDYQALQDALNSGDVAGAQKAFASLKQDLKAGHAHHGHHRHHRVDNDGDADDSSSGSTPPSGGTDVTTSTTSVGATLDTQA